MGDRKVNVKLRVRGVCKRCHQKTSFTNERKDYCKTCQAIIDGEKTRMPLTKKPLTLQPLQINPKIPEAPKEKIPEPKPPYVPKPKINPEIPIQPEPIPKEEPKEEVEEVVVKEELKPNKQPKNVDFGVCATCKKSLGTELNSIRGKVYCNECFEVQLHLADEYEIRLATLQDIKRMNKCCEIWIQRDQSKRKKLLRDMLRNPSFFIVIAILKKEIVGFMGWHIIREWTTTYNRLISTGIFLHPKHRHKGILTKMWEKTLEEIKDFELCIVDTILEYPQYLGFQKSKMSLWLWSKSQRGLSDEYY